MNNGIIKSGFEGSLDNHVTLQVDGISKLSLRQCRLLIKTTFPSRLIRDVEIVSNSLLGVGRLIGLEYHIRDFSN